MNTKKPRVTLENWCYCYHPSGNHVLVGKNIQGHPRVENIEGHRFMTSPIVSVQGNNVETRNSIYELIGPPDNSLAAQLFKDKGIPLIAEDLPTSL
jgi:hypothetical protein